MPAHHPNNNLAQVKRQGVRKGRTTAAYKVLLAAGLITTGVISGCNQMNQNKSADPASQQNQHSTIWPQSAPKHSNQAEISARVNSIIEGMTLEQKVAQMIQPEIRDFTVEDMRQYGFGSYLNGGGSFPNQNKNASIDDWVTLAENMYQASVDDTLDGSTIPAMWGTDAVHGHTNVRGATVFPHNIGLGAAHNPELVKAIAETTAKEVSATGIDWVFAPTVAVTRDDRWGRSYESYSEDPELVADYAAAFVEGMQGPLNAEFLSARHTIATLKHFVGDGGTQNGDDQGDTQVDESTLYQIHAQGYRTGIAAGAQTVMASFNSWQGDKVHGHRYLLQEVLKDKMGFDGLVVGDWNGHGQVPGCSNESCPQSINAGVDIVMVPGKSWKPLYHNTIEQVKQGVISEARINDAVKRILTVKLRAGLFDKPSPAQRAVSGNTDIIGHSEHRQLARQAVRESLVLLKNNDSLLPINPTQTILLAGTAAHNIGQQSGGWTLTWQGTGNQNEDFPGASSIYQGMAEQVKQAGGNIELSETGEFTERPDVAVVVFGEEPYAEGNGDLDNLEFERGDKQSLAILKKLKAQNIPVVSVFISGRPMWVNPELNQSDAFVAAWLPGSEGAGIADVLLTDKLGDVQNDFTGRLSFSWPMTPDAGPLNAPYADESNVLFPLGYGLTYQSSESQLQQLPEIFNTDNPQTAVNKTLFERVAIKPLQVMISNGEQQKVQTSNTLKIPELELRTIDRQVQEDALSLNWRDSKTGAGFLLQSPFPEDYRGLFQRNSVLHFDVRAQAMAKQPMWLTMNCATQCEKGIDIGSMIKGSDQAAKWQTITVPLSCFSNNSRDFGKVFNPFTLWSNGAWQLELSHIRIERQQESQTSISCDQA